MLPSQPPEPPQLFGLGMQSTSSCGASTGSVPVAMNTADSIDCVAENAQHEPQPPWSFVGVTAPFVRQSTEAGRSAGVMPASNFM